MSYVLAPYTSDWNLTNVLFFVFLFVTSVIVLLFKEVCLTEREVR